MALETHRWCDNDDRRWVSWCMQSVQYSLAVAGRVAHTDSFLWDSLWLQPMAGLCVLSPHSHTHHAFLIPVRVQTGNSKKRKRKGLFLTVRLSQVSCFYISPCPSSSSYWAVLCTSCILHIRNHRITKGCWRHVSTSFYSPATGADESQNYITRLALAQGTSDGNRGPSPGFRVTHWIWQTPNMVRQREFLRNMGDIMTVKKQHAVGRRLWHLNRLEPFLNHNCLFCVLKKKKKTFYC